MLKKFKKLKILLIISMFLLLTLVSISSVTPATTPEEVVLQPPITIIGPAPGFLYFGLGLSIPIPFGLTIIFGMCRQLWVSAQPNVDLVEWSITDLAGNQLLYIGGGTQPPLFQQDHTATHWPTGSLPSRCIIQADAYSGFWPNTVYLGSDQLTIWKFF